MIQNLKLYPLLNGSGSSSLLVKLWTKSGVYSAKVPAAGLDGAGIRKNSAIFSSLRPNFIGLNEEDWASFDSFLSEMNPQGAMDHSLSLALSLACARAATQNELWRLRGAGKTFPYIMGTVALGKDWKEFVLIPHRESNIQGAFHSLREAWKVAGDEMKEKGYLAGRTMSGAWLTELSDVETLYLLSGIASDWKMRLGVNVGATSFWDQKSRTYRYGARGNVIKKQLTTDEHMSLISAVAEQYRLWYLEDPFHSDDNLSHAHLSQKLENTIVSGGDLYSGSLERLKGAAKLSATKAISVDPAQLYSVSQLASVCEFARGRGMKVILSRSPQETEDNWLADLAVAFSADLLKLGLAGADNISKFNRLIEAWEDSPAPRIGLPGGSAAAP